MLELFIEFIEGEKGKKIGGKPLVCKEYQCRHFLWKHLEVNYEHIRRITGSWPYCTGYR